MTDVELFEAAVRAAQAVTYWRQQAAEAGKRERAGLPAPQFAATRRQCLRHVQKRQGRVVDLAIEAEQRARRAECST